MESALATCALSALFNLEKPLFILSSDFKCVFLNQACLELFQMEFEDSASLDARTFWPEVETQCLSRDPVASVEFLLADGRKLLTKLRCSQVDEGFVLVQLVAARASGDIEQFFHTQRMETLGVLASGIAHDFNNILAGILGHISYLKTVLPDEGDHAESLQAIEEGGKKASLMTQEILNFARFEVEGKPVSFNLCELTRRTCKLLRGAISPLFNIVVSAPEDPIRILAVEGKIAQVIANLMINSRDALESDGTIQVMVEVCADTSELKRVFEGRDLPAARCAVITVQDDGHGIPEDVQASVFDAYFSTKQEQGTGLGLATVKAIVQEFGGAIDLDSVPGEGTTITVFFPLVEGATESGEEQAGSRPTILTGTERVLVVDDEYPVRNILSMSLEHLGYEVSVASSGHEALQMVENANGSFDLVILDMLMPNLSGEEVFAALHEAYPELPVLIISGFASEEAVRNILENGGRGFMQKPFTIEELSVKVRECLI